MTSYTSNNVQGAAVETRIRSLVAKEDQLNSFYEAGVQQIVKSKMDKFTYGGEVELGGLLPNDEDPYRRQKQEKKIKGLLKSGLVKPPKEN